MVRVGRPRRARGRAPARNARLAALPRRSGGTSSAGLRVLTLDRPGYGLSTPRPSRRSPAWPRSSSTWPTRVGSTGSRWSASPAACPPPSPLWSAPGLAGHPRRCGVRRRADRRAAGICTSSLTEAERDLVAEIRSDPAGAVDRLWELGGWYAETPLRMLDTPAEGPDGLALDDPATRANFVTSDTRGRPPGPGRARRRLDRGCPPVGLHPEGRLGAGRHLGRRPRSGPGAARRAGDRTAHSGPARCTWTTTPATGCCRRTGPRSAPAASPERNLLMQQAGVNRSGRRESRSHMLAPMPGPSLAPAPTSAGRSPTSCSSRLGRARLPQGALVAARVRPWRSSTARARAARPDAAVAEVVHGTTVATNAVLERRGARTALVTTQGFRDVLELRRVRMPHLYDLFWSKPPPLVERSLRLELDERMSAEGEVLRPLDDDEVRARRRAAARAEVESVAVCLLHAHRHPEHERRWARSCARSSPACRSRSRARSCASSRSTSAARRRSSTPTSGR